MDKHEFWWGTGRRPKPQYIHNILFWMKRLYLRGRQHQINLLRFFGLTPARLEVMRMLLDGYRTQPGLGRALGVSRSTLSRMLIAMESRGLVVRTARATQRARKRVILAAAQVERIKELLIGLHDVYGAALANVLGATSTYSKAFIDQIVATEQSLVDAARGIGDRPSPRYTLLEYFDH